VLKVKLTPEETEYYRRLFIEDSNYYTIIDSLKQLSIFDQQFSNNAEILAFVEFASNLFHIHWEKDVYVQNHLRLIDIFLRLQYNVEFKKDRQSQEIVDKLLERFFAIYQKSESLMQERVFHASEQLIAKHNDRIPHKEKLFQQLNLISKLSLPYLFTFYQEILQGGFPEWKLPLRKGIYIDSITYEVIRYQTEERIKFLINSLKNK